MNLNPLLEKLEKHYQNKLPFVLYSLPNEETVTVVLQNDTRLYNTKNYNEEGFVFAPFDYKDSAFYIPFETEEQFRVSHSKKKVVTKEIKVQQSPQEKYAYFEKIESTIKKIKSRQAKKIVISRKQEIRLDNFDLTTLITRLLNIDTSAFRYVWFHPKTGLWCGASPEVLVQTEGSSFTTMALAGTQPYTTNEEYSWNNKEIEEQKIVVDEITTNLQRVTSVVKLSKTYTHKAGSLVHLRTDISGILKKGKTTLSTITSALHPTPAICGTPQKFAKKYILEHENYSREFYTGFLGPIFFKESYSKLFVNLRCMKIENNKAQLFIGGGITIDSKPESEWEETVQKLETMVQVLSPML